MSHKSPASGLILSSAIALAMASPALAENPSSDRQAPDEAYQGLPTGEGSEQAGPPQDSVFDDNWLTIGVGAGLGTSYSGSNDYVLIPAPLLRGRLGPVRINPRPAGAAFDVLPKSRGGTNFELGPVVRFRNDRADQIEDPIVELAGELDSAFEIGVAGGVSLPGILNRFDSLSVSADMRWDVAGAHDGHVIQPGISYFSPLNRGTAISVGVSAEFVDDKFADYYYSVSPSQSAASGLPQFTASGGLDSVGANALLAVDLDGNAANGGLGVFAIGGYSRLIGDAADTPYTAQRGSANQAFGAVGIGFTF